MKKLATVLLFILSTFSLFAQNEGQTRRIRGFALGADADTLQYIVASPFDNWYFHFGGGVQTFIGNEVFASARKNKLDFQLFAEIGKWIIPDVSVSVHAKYFTVHGQSRYGRQPFIDVSETPDERGYRHFGKQALSLGGLVTLDWTNFFYGYEAGARKKIHVLTPIGLGASMLFGKQENANIRETSVGTPKFNFELYYTAGFTFEYLLSKHFTIDANLAIFGSESTWDWSPYDNSYSRFDIMPMLTLGGRLNLFKQAYKYDKKAKNSDWEDVNHVFLAYGTKTTVGDLQDKIEDLYHRIDTLMLNSGNGPDNANEIDSLERMLDSLQHQLYTTPSTPEFPSAVNALEELMNANEILNLPAVVVYYELDKYDLDYNANKKLYNFAKQARNLGDSVTFYLIGAADSVTGTPRHNQKLSENRCKSVYNVLVNELGLPSTMFDVRALGGILEYDPKEFNRIGLVILKTKETTDIINKWSTSKE